MKTLNKIIFCCLLFFCFSKISAQNSPAKWGKFSKAEIEMKKCAFDTSAGAIILSDYGVMDFIYNGYYSITRHIRIKIFNKREFEQANIVLPYYFDNKFEDITNISAQTINFEADGTPIIQKVEKNQIITQALDSKWNEKRFTFPNVKEGSIIEYKYDKFSQNFRFLDGWLFQTNIPTLHSEFKANFVEGLDYRMIYNGTRLYDKTYKNLKNHWILENLPAVRVESFVYNPWDFAEKLRFQLIRYKRLSSTSYMTDPSPKFHWERFMEKLLSENNYNGYLNRGGLAKKTLENILKGNETNLEKLKKIYYYVNKNIKCNENYHYLVTDNIRDVIDKQHGNSAEINLFLTALLREADFETYPMIMSTKQNGLAMLDYPLESQFNHVIVWTKLDNNEYLLDASQDYPFNLLPVNDLNYWAYKVTKDTSKAGWIEIKPKTNTLESYFVEADLSNLQKPQYKVNAKFDGYEGVGERNKYFKEKDEYFKKFFHSTGLKMNTLEVKNFENVESPLQVLANLESEESIEADQIYYQPILFNDYKENPFNFETRYLPIDLAYPFKKEYYLKFTLPNGYKLEESPKNLQLALPDKAGNFIYSVTKMDKIIQINYRINLQKTFFVPQEFSALKEFFNQIIAKLAEPIVLKKE